MPNDLARPTLPPVFLSHGSPMIALEPGATGAFFARLGQAVQAHHGRPQALLLISAHTAMRHRARADAVLLGAARHAAVHDFGGFDARLNALRYDAPGAPDWAARAVEQLQQAGLRAQHVDQGGLDHGIWTALMHLRPAADWPVVPMAWGLDATPQQLEGLGRALQTLVAQGVWVVATGSITHNLARVFGQGGGGRGAPDETMPEIAESRAFRDWWAEQAAQGHADALRDWVRRAPYALDMHPSSEHLLPWFVASGAAPGPAVRLHDAVTFGSLGMDAYAFGPDAARLAAWLAGPPRATPAPADGHPASAGR